jgi:hypothetical protein
MRTKTTWLGQWSLCKSKIDTDTISQEGDIKKLIACLSYAQIVAKQTEKDGIAIIPGYIESGERKDESVKHHDLMMFDFDDSTKDQIEKLQELPFYWFMYTSFNHGTKVEGETKRRVKFRLVVPLSRSVMPDEYKSVWLGVSQYLRTRFPDQQEGIDNVDQVCKNPSRIFYTARVQNPDAIYDFEAQESTQTNLLNPDHYKVKPEQVITAKKVGKRLEIVTDAITAYGREALKESALEIEIWPKGAGRNEALNRLCYKLGQLVGAGALKFEDVVHEMRRACDAQGPIPELEKVGAIDKAVRAGMEQPRDLSHVGELEGYTASDFEVFSKSIRMIVEREKTLNTALKSNESTDLDSIFYPENLIGQIVRDILNTSEFSYPEIALCGAICIINTAISQKIQLSSSGIQPNIYTLALAPSGTGKNSVISYLSKLRNEVGEGMQKTDGGSEFTGSAAILSALKYYPVRLAFFDEFGDTMQSNKRSMNSQKSEVVQLLKSLATMSSSSYSKMYADQERTFTIHNPMLSIYATGTPKKFWQTMSMDDIEGGFLGRWFVVSVNRPNKPNRKVSSEISPGVIESLKKLYGTEIVYKSIPEKEDEIELDLDSILESSSIFKDSVANYYKDLGREQEARQVEQEGLSVQSSKKKEKRELTEYGSRIASIHTVHFSESARELFDEKVEHYLKLRDEEILKDERNLNSIYSRFIETAGKLCLCHYAARNLNEIRNPQRKVELQDVRWAVALADYIFKQYTSNIESNVGKDLADRTARQFLSNIEKVEDYSPETPGQKLVSKVFNRCGSTVSPKDRQAVLQTLKEDAKIELEQVQTIRNDGKQGRLVQLVKKI